MWIWANEKSSVVNLTVISPYDVIVIVILTKIESRRVGHLGFEYSSYFFSQTLSGSQTLTAWLGLRIWDLGFMIYRL